jgi:hypothetical protein
MGQKSNKLTLKKNFNNLNLTTFNTKNFKNFFYFYLSFKRLLFLKGIWLTNTVINSSTNTHFLNFIFYYKSNKVIIYKKKKVKLRKNVLVFKKSFCGVSSLLNQYFSFFRINSFSVFVLNLNKKIDTKIITFLFKKLTPYYKKFFIRRYNLFIDFLKLCTLFILNLLPTESFLLLLSLIFKHLTKRSHRRFLSFLKFLFNLIVFSVPEKFNALSSYIKGFKFSVSGRILGKARASYFYIQEGTLPFQTFSKNVYFSKIHIYTLLGSFGFRLWVYRQEIK